MKKSELIATVALSCLLLGGCKKSHCDKLVAVACEHVAEKKDGEQRCTALKKQAESVDDDECRQTLELLRESGQIGGAAAR